MKLAFHASLVLLLSCSLSLFAMEEGEKQPKKAVHKLAAYNKIEQFFTKHKRARPGWQDPIVNKDDELDETIPLNKRILLNKIPELAPDILAYAGYVALQEFAKKYKDKKLEWNELVKKDAIIAYQQLVTCALARPNMQYGPLLLKKEAIYKLYKAFDDLFYRITGKELIAEKTAFELEGEYKHFAGRYWWTPPVVTLPRPSIVTLMEKHGGQAWLVLGDEEEYALLGPEFKQVSSLRGFSGFEIPAGIKILTFSADEDKFPVLSKSGLSLYHNIEDIPLDTFARCGEVKKLKLYSQRLRLNPNIFVPLIQLQEFVCHGSYKLNLFGELPTLSHLHTINLRNCGLKNIPLHFLRNTTALKCLLILKNTLKTLPDLSNCSQLEKFYAYNNKITKLKQKQFFYCGNLKDVGLSSNQLVHIPSQLFIQNVLLRDVYLTSNHILTVPKDLLFSLSVLHRICLDSNYIERLPKDFFYSTKELESIHLENNRISVLQADMFSTLERLKRLYLSDNCIRAVPVNLFKHNHELTTLNLDGNKIISFVAKHVAHLRKLGWLFLQYNHLSNWTKEELQEELQKKLPQLKLHI